MKIWYPVQVSKTLIHLYPTCRQRLDPGIKRPPWQICFALPQLSVCEDTNQGQAGSEESEEKKRDEFSHSGWKNKIVKVEKSNPNKCKHPFYNFDSFLENQTFNSLYCGHQLFHC